MKRVLAISLVATTALFATNGDHLISVGTKARGMGGAGIGISHCAESTLQNPALITCTKGTSVSFGGTIFMPDVSAKMGQAPYKDSDADLSVIPGVAISHKIDDNWYVGIGMWGTAGMGVDYRDAKQSQVDSGNMHMVTNLQLMQFGVSLAYTQANFGIAVTPLVQYGSLDINYQDMQGKNVGDGVAQDLGYGANLGAYYDFSNGFKMGAVYKTKIDMEYKHQLSRATQPFVDAGIFPQAMGDHLEQPSEAGVGISYEYLNNTFALDYKQIYWSDAKGYKEFGWDDQDVIALGYQYKQACWSFRLGYNHADNPIQEKQSGPAQIAPGQYQYAGGNALNLFNLLGFPATVEDHYTIGGGYDISKNFSVDFAYVYAPESKTTMKTIVGMNPQTGALYTGDSTVKHSQTGLSVALSYRFY